MTSSQPSPASPSSPSSPPSPPTAPSASKSCECRHNCGCVKRGEVVTTTTVASSAKARRKHENSPDVHPYCTAACRYHEKVVGEKQRRLTKKAAAKAAALAPASVSTASAFSTSLAPSSLRPSSSTCPSPSSTLPSSTLAKAAIVRPPVSSPTLSAANPSLVNPSWNTPSRSPGLSLYEDLTLLRPMYLLDNEDHPLHMSAGRSEREACVPFPFIPQVADDLYNTASAPVGIKLWSVPLTHRFISCPAQAPPLLSTVLSRRVERSETAGVNIDVPAKTRQTPATSSSAPLIHQFDESQHAATEPEAFLDEFARHQGHQGVKFYPYNKDLEDSCPWMKKTHHYLNTTSFIDSPLNLARLMSDARFFSFSGFNTSLLYSKVPGSWFHNHCEQLFAPAYNLCIDGRGTTWWCVGRKDNDKFQRFLIQWIKRLRGLDDGAVLEGKDEGLLLALLWAKKVFIDPREVRAAGVEVFLIDQRPGEVVLLDGDIVHSGVCSYDQSLNEAVNFIPVQWLVDGLSRMEKWVDWLVDDYIAAEMADRLHRNVKDLIFDVDVKARLAQHVPRGVTHLLLETVQRSVEGWQKGVKEGGKEGGVVEVEREQEVGKEKGGGKQRKGKKRKGGAGEEEEESGSGAPGGKDEKREEKKKKKADAPALKYIDYSGLSEKELQEAVARIARVKARLEQKHVWEWYSGASPDERPMSEWEG